MITSNHQAQLRELISASVRAGASDLHLSVGTMPAARIDHELKIINKDLVLTAEFVQEAASFLAGLAGREVKKEILELSFAVTIETGLRLKVNIFYQKGLPAVSIRFIPNQIKTIEQLGLPDRIQQFAALHRGLVIIAGPYGSGRTTTAAALIHEINTKRHNYIMTLERPIEYIFSSQESIIEQREVGRDTLSFEQAFNYVRQEDVDVLMLSELSSPKIILSVLDTANSGVLIIAISDADTPTGVIAKIINSFEGQKQHLVRRLLGDVLSGIVVQRLVPRVGGGQIPAVSILIATDAVRLAIKEGRMPQIENLLITSAKEGMVSLDRYLFDLAKKNLISKDDAIRQAIDPEELEKMLKRI